MSNISTAELAAELSDRLDDLVLSGEIPKTLYDKYSTSSRLAKAINEADIDVCGWLKPNSTAILKVPKGKSDILVRKSGADLGSPSQIPTSHLTEYKSIDEFVDYSQVRSGTAKLYKEYPVGDTVAFGTVRFVPSAEFDSYAGTTGMTACVDYYTGRLRLSFSLDEDAFITFQAQVLPTKLKIRSNGRDPLEIYKIKTPGYANELLSHVSLMKLLPKNTQYYSILRSELYELKLTAYDNMPVETGVIQLESDFFDDL